ncbi:MAG: hypothetical protein QXW97_04590 [Candidatus Pacearchaeota archaeon]
MTKEMNKLWIRAFIGIFIILFIYFLFFLYGAGYFNFLTGKAINKLEDVNYEVNQEDKFIILTYYWWVFLIIAVLILILIFLIFILKRIISKRKDDFYTSQTKNSYLESESVISKCLNLIKKSKEAGISDEEIKKIFKDAGWKDKEINNIFLKLKQNENINYNKK